MRNIVVYCSLVLLLLWGFISIVFVDVPSESEENTEQGNTNSVSDYTPIDVDVKKLSLLLGVEFEKETLAEEIEISKELEISLEVVVIYTSKDQQKVRLNKLVNEEREEVDMQLGDSIYKYRLTEINPSFIVFDNGEEEITLKVFESIIISVLDSPKEKTE